MSGPRLAGKVAIVTGAGSRGEGIGNGRAAAVLFAREGARVLLVDQTRKAAEETLGMIHAEGDIGALAGDGGLKDALDFSPKRLAKMLYCGCLAADAMMQSEFLQPSMAENCRERFGAYPSAACQSPAIQVALSPPAGKAKPAAD